MLEPLRRKAKLIIWATTILVVPSFIFLFGVRGRLSSSKKVSYAGILFGRKVSLQEFGRAWWACRNRAVMLHGEERLRETPELLNFDQEAWDRLTLLREARRQGITTSDQEVVKRIKTLFADKGEFDQRNYHFYLRYRLRTRPRTFEEQLRNDITIAKLITRVTNEVGVTDALLEEEYQREFERVEADYILVEPEEFAAEVGLEPVEIEAYYQQHREDFRLPERVNVEYAAINYSDLEDEVSISNENIEEYYRTHQEEFRKPASPEGEEIEPEEEKSYRPLEEVKDRIRRRLVQEQVRRLAEKKAEEIADRLIDNPDLEEEAEMSGYPVKETGFFGKQDPIPSIGWSFEFIRAAFRLKEGETSNVIRTGRGCYLIRLKEKRASTIPELEEIKEEVEAVLRQEKAKILAEKKAQEYYQVLKEEKSDFRQGVKELGLELKEAPPFSRHTYLPGLGEAEEFIRACFRLQEGEMSEVVSTSKGYAILKIKKFYPADLEKLVEEKDAYRMKVLGRLQQEHYGHWFESLKGRADLKVNPDWTGTEEES